jgi:hypothetical protein
MSNNDAVTRKAQISLSLFNTLILNLVKDDGRDVQFLPAVFPARTRSGLVGGEHLYEIIIEKK